MKMMLLSAVAIAFSAASCAAFVPKPSFSVLSALPMAQVELVPEPEGGEELVQIDTMVGSRMKKMGPCDDVESEDGAQVYNFWLSAVADGTLIKEVRTRVEKDASKKANFPGFRKGQIPPYAQPQITTFAIQEGILNTIEAAIGAYGLKSLPGKDSEVEVLEDVPEMCKGYKSGDSLQFTATVKATIDPDKQQVSESEEDESVEEEVTSE